MKLVTQVATDRQTDRQIVMPQTFVLYVVYCKNTDTLQLKSILKFDVL